MSLSIMSDLSQCLCVTLPVFCEWKLVLTISHSKKSSRSQCVGNPGVWSRETNEKWNKTLTENELYTCQVLENTLKTMSMLPKSCKTQLMCYCPVTVLIGSEVQQRTNYWNKHFTWFLWEGTNSVNTNWHLCTCYRRPRNPDAGLVRVERTRHL